MYDCANITIIYVCARGPIVATRNADRLAMTSPEDELTRKCWRFTELEILVMCSFGKAPDLEKRLFSWNICIAFLNYPKEDFIDETHKFMQSIAMVHGQRVPCGFKVYIDAEKPWFP